MTDLCTVFDRCYVINLKRRPDRLKAFFDQLEEVGWPFPWPEVWDAVDGGSGKVPCPAEFTQGGGAWGCRQSHVGILEHCLMNDIGSVLILEDDAFLRDNFLDDLKAFMAKVPDDWEGIMLGGQHHNRPTKLEPGLVKVNYAQRTQAYGCRGRYMRDLYARWAVGTVHIDWLMQNWQHNYNVYAPELWLIGQAHSKSDINGRVNAATCWNPVNTDRLPVILLKTPKAVMQTLRDQYGFHCGYDRDPATDLDVALPACFDPKVRERERDNRLRNWLNVIKGECGQTDWLVTTVWHPDATEKQLRRCTPADVFVVEGDTVEAALANVPPGVFKRQRKPVKQVMLLHAPKAVVPDLRAAGFHFGYWRDHDEVDNGLHAIFGDDSLTDDQKVEKLKGWFRELRSEASSFGGVVVVRHPKADRKLIEAAGEVVVEISAEGSTSEDARNVRNIWKAAVEDDDDDDHA